MEKSELQLPEKFGQYVDIDTMIEEGDKTWDTQGISDKYSTGLSLLVRSQCCCRLMVSIIPTPFR